MKYAALGIDLGSVRIGVAICEASGLPAVPLTTILHTSRERDVEAIVRLARERDARTIVVGNPLRLDGSVGPAAKKVEIFVRKLRAAFDGEVVAMDERLTTAAAQKKLRADPNPQRVRKRYIDQLAAVEILDSYLARQGGS